MSRFLNWLRAVYNRMMNRLEDPEDLLDLAKRDMQETLKGNREKAVQAVTQRNKLQAMYDEAVKKSTQLESQAVKALQTGNRDLARQFVREKASNDQVVVQLKGSLEQAANAVEAVKVAIRRQEEEVRKKTAEALAAKAQWKQAQIQNSIAKALEGLTFENQFENFGVATERIKDVQAEAAARQEMLNESLQGKIMQMQDQVIDEEAESELQKLEERLGMRGAPATTEEQTVQVGAGGTPEAVTEAPAVPTSQVDAELEALEKRIGGSGTTAG